MAVFEFDVEKTAERQKSIAIWSFVFFVLLFVHMLLDPILHWD
ncbi:MAG: hypothetical protein ACXAE3_03615 [Candidatus Kariarchaeaceae archaeon]|jgi:hypothetical protein